MSGNSTNLVLTVAKQGPADAQTINEAIQMACPGQVIHVFPGIYQENIVLDRNVELIGQNTHGEIVIEGTGAPCLDIKTEQAVVKNFTLRGAIGVSGPSLGPEPTYYGVVVLQGNLVLEGCNISVDDGPAIYIKGRKLNAPIQQVIDLIPYVHYMSFFKLEDFDMTENEELSSQIEQPQIQVEIKNCQIHNSEIGVFIRQKVQVLLEKCNFSYLTECAISASLKPELIAKHCTIQNCIKVGVDLSDLAKGVFENCSLLNTRWPVLLSNDSSIVFRQSTIQNMHKFKQPECIILENCNLI